MRILLFFVFLLFLSGCGVKTISDDVVSTGTNFSGFALESGASVEDLSIIVLGALRDNNINFLSSIVSNQGVRFSPYSYVDVKENLELTSDELLQAWNTGNYLWGTADGSGEPLRMSLQEYFSLFVYDVDFAQLSEEYINTPLQRGNTINNVFDVYSGAYIVEYYVPGLNPEYEGMDWKSLTLVFVKESGIWKLRAIVHNQWTI